MRVTGRSRTDKPLTLAVSVVKAANAFPRCVLDGELIGEQFICFDVLEYEGKSLLSLPYEQRLRYLAELPQSESILVTPTAQTVFEKRELMATAKRTGMEGVVLKRKDKPYSPGRPNTGGPALKFKFVQTCEVICAGQRGSKRSVGMMLFDGTEIGSLTIPPNKLIPKRGDVLSVRVLYRGAEDGHLVQAVFLGVRDDVPASACTADRIQVKGAVRT